MKLVPSALLLTALVASASLAGAQVADKTEHADAPSIAVGRTTQQHPQIVENKELAAKALQNHVVRVQVWPKKCHAAKCVRHIKSYNSRVDAGANAVANNISGTQVAIFKYIALTADSGAVAKGDTTCPAEISTGGLSRTAGTYGNYTAPSALNGTASYTVTATYTATAGYTLNKLCMFNAASNGTMLFETLLGATVTGNNGDVITVTWTVQV